MNEDNRNGWNEYSRLVLKELSDLNSDVKEIRSEIQNLRTDIITLKVKAGTWGAIASIIVSCVVAIITSTL